MASPAPMSPTTLTELMAKSLPKGEPTRDSTPLKEPSSAVALFCHACMLAVGFRLIGLGEDHKIEAQSEPEHARPLPPEWDASTTYAFRYAHSQSSMEYLLKIHRLGSKTVVFGLGLGDDKTASFEIKTQDYISDGSLKNLSSGEIDASSIGNVFISPGRISDLSSLVKINVIQKLAPGLRKSVHNDATETAEVPRRHEETRPPPHSPLRDDLQPPARPYPFDDPLAALPRRPMPAGDFPPPGFEDEYEIQRPPRGMPDAMGPRPRFGIGERDLYPPGLGPHDPLRAGPNSGGGFPGGGMHPTFDDPLFAGQGGAAHYDPRTPPGARYDPVGPGDGPPNVRGGLRFPGGGAGGGFGGNPFGGFGSNDFI